MAVVLSPFRILVTLFLVIWFGIFIGVPLFLLFPRLKPLILMLLITGYGISCWIIAPLSETDTENPLAPHCGLLTFTGLFYDLRPVLTDAYRDDLEVRNQMCWLRKLISGVPSKFETAIEMEQFSTMTRERLLRPEIKFRANLPLVAILNFKISSAAYDNSEAKDIYNSIRYWENFYTDEIRLREYKLWNWPHSNYIKMEYGLIEENWQKLIDHLVLEEN
jgi:hypothetical protein